MANLKQINNILVGVCIGLAIALGAGCTSVHTEDRVEVYTVVSEEVTPLRLHRGRLR